MAGVETWLPEGRFTDIFTGRIYKGGRTKIFRDVASIPVLAKEGAIIPLDLNDSTNRSDNPEALEILIFRGNNSFLMYEDDGESMNYQKGAFAQTLFEVAESENGLRFKIAAATGDRYVLPQKRKYKLSFRDIVSAEKISAVVGGLITDSFRAYSENGTLVIEFENVNVYDDVCLDLDGVSVLKNPDKREMLIDCISKFQTKNGPKSKTFTDYVNGKAKMPAVAKSFAEPLEEIENLFYF